MRQLEHPNIINLIDFSESKQYYYIILELAPGGELFHQIVRLTYFSEDLSRHVIIQVARALEYLHEVRGVVHRSVTISRPFAFPLSALRPVPQHVCLTVIYCGLVFVILTSDIDAAACVVDVIGVHPSIPNPETTDVITPLSTYGHALRAHDAAVQR
jgi:hypothetical protein